jgi:hypothetical protein
MRIKLIRKETSPTIDDLPIWEGGYDGEDSDEFPGSIVTELSQDLDVGNWHALEQFKESFEKSSTPNETWTEVSVPVLTAEGASKVNIQVEQYQASHMLIEAVLHFAELFQNGGRLWIRVE